MESYIFLEMVLYIKGQIVNFQKVYCLLQYSNEILWNIVSFFLVTRSKSKLFDLIRKITIKFSSIQFSMKFHWLYL